MPPTVLTCQTKPADPWAPARVQFRPDRHLNREFVPVVVVAGVAKKQNRTGLAGLDVLAACYLLVAGRRPSVTRSLHHYAPHSLHTLRCRRPRTRIVVFVIVLGIVFGVGVSLLPA